MGFEPPEEDSADALLENSNAGKARMVNFSYSKEKEDGTIEEFSLEVPLLTIVPIPYIRIDEMTIDFTAKLSEAHIKSDIKSAENVAEKSKSASASISGGGLFFSAKGSYSYNASHSSSHKSSSKAGNKYNTEYTMNVYLRATQDDMPAGLSKILEILNSSIKEKPKPIE